MPTRDECYRKFGPILLEAVCQVFVEEFNELRKNQGMPEITDQKIIDSLMNHCSKLLPYDWMNQ